MAFQWAIYKIYVQKRANPVILEAKEVSFI